MVTPLTIIDFDGLAGVILPQEVLDRLQAGVGDTLSLIETPDGSELRSGDAELTRQMEIAERIMTQEYDLLRQLAD